jgi:transposase
MLKQRNNYTPEEKINILKMHLLEKKQISDICDEYKLHPTVFHRWIKIFFENGASAFISKPEKREILLEKKIQELENKLSRKNEVLSELMEEHVKLKKNIGEI